MPASRLGLTRDAAALAVNAEAAGVLGTVLGGFLSRLGIDRVDRVDVVLEGFDAGTGQRLAAKRVAYRRAPGVRDDERPVTQMSGQETQRRASAV